MGTTTQPYAGPARPAAAPGPPDINAETFPFEVVLRALDRAAVFNLYSTPDPAGPGGPTRSPDGRAIGVRVAERLHSLAIDTDPPRPGAGLRIRNSVGAAVARFSHHWRIIPDGYSAYPGCDPPPTPLDPTRPQRFALLDGTATFDGGRDGFRGFGTGRTFPATGPGRGPLLVGAVGTLVEGFGAFAGLEGTYTYCGTLDEAAGFRGSVVCRVVDPRDALGRLHPRPEPGGPAPDDGATYFWFCGRKQGRGDRTEYSYAPDGHVDGLKVGQELRLPRGPGSPDGAVIGSMRATIGFNLFSPGAPGTAAAPIPFRSYNAFAFTDPAGREFGRIDGDGSEGRTFNLELAGLPGQRALRFGGFGPLRNGAGAFAGVRGLMTDNSVVGIAPHALATLYVLRMEVPDGRFGGAAEPAPGDGWGPCPPVRHGRSTDPGH